MELPRAIQSECGWLKVGDPANDLVISCRIRLARNIEGIPFSQWASSSDLKRIAEKCKEAARASSYLRDSMVLQMDNLSSMDRHFLAEGYVISREFTKSGIERYVVIHPDQTVSMMINEEDHLRLQMIMAGANLRQVWETINNIDNELESQLEYAFSNRFGFLTACPTNLGTGIRCSIMVHLPALVISRRIEQVLNAVTQMGLTVRGFAGEGSEIIGNLFQISNQWTLGVTENGTIEKLESILNNIVDQERKAQTELFETKRTMIEDKVWRAYATVNYARMLPSSEAVELFSTLRLGRSLGILDAPTYQRLSEMIIETRPAHLQKRAGKSLSPNERDIFRAETIRNWIRNGLQNN